MDFRSIRVSGKIENKWIWSEIIGIIQFLYVKYIEKMGLPIFLIDFLCILPNYIDNFSPNPLFSIFSETRIDLKSIDFRFFRIFLFPMLKPQKTSQR